MNNLEKKPGREPAGERKKKEVLVPVDIHPLAISQARAFANLSRSLAMGIKDGGDHGELLAYLVNAGLSIELYLKALQTLDQSFLLGSSFTHLPIFIPPAATVQAAIYSHLVSQPQAKSDH